MDIVSARAKLSEAAALMRVGEMGERLADRDLSTLLARAQEVMADTYTFSKTWDMERCRVPFALPKGAYDWNVVNNDDEEWCFMLNRMDFLEDLALASLVTGEASYAEKAAALIGSWVEAHPAIVPELSTRTLDTGIRIRTWATVLPALDAAGALSDELLERTLGSIRTQIASLRERYLPKYETSNWGSIQTLGILTVLATIGDDPESDPDWAWAKERAESQMAAQVYPDGIDWEQSTMYHVEVLLYALRALHVLEARGLEAPLGLRGATDRLAHGLAAQMMPDGCIDAQGDSDRTDVRGLLALCAGVLGDAALARASGRTQLDAGDLFAFGCDVEDALAACAGKAGAELPLVFDGVDSGLFVARSSWGADANMTVFSSGPLGSGHGHSDNLHVTVVYQGAPVLVDAGRFTYREDSPVRPYLKGPRAHNVALLDGRSSCVPKGSWGYSDFGCPLKTYARHAGGAHYFEGALVGHDPLHVLVRKLVALDCGVWICADEALAEGEHELVSRFHFDPGVRVAPDGEACRVSCAAGELVLGSTGSISVGSEQISLDYNVLSDAALVEVRSGFAERGSQLWWMASGRVRVSPVPVLRGGSEPVDTALAEAVRFEVGADEFYTVAFFHGEAYTGVKAFACEGVSFHAKAVVVHGMGERRELTVLRA